MKPKLTISLHSAYKHIMERQMEMLHDVNDVYDIKWNNRYHRHPESYDSYSEMVNETVATSETEYIILMNDRVCPQPQELFEIIDLLQDGYAAATKYSVGFMGVTKEVFRRIGFWDERFYGGGYEDDDFVLRLHLEDLAYYESLESYYDMSFKSDVRPPGGDRCAKSEPFFYQKWKVEPDTITKVLPEENYDHKYDLGANEDIYWKPWSASQLNIAFDHPRTGKSRTHWFLDNNLNQYRQVKNNDRMV